MAGRFVRALLWFPLGQIRSLFIATGIGFAGARGAVLYALWQQSIWIGIMAFFLLSQAALGWKQAKYLQMEAAESARVVPDETHLPEKRTVL